MPSWRVRERNIKTPCRKIEENTYKIGFTINKIEEHTYTIGFAINNKKNTPTNFKLVSQ